jgi:hypothetical protein
LEIHPCIDSCAIKKLALGYNFIICNELFAIGKSIISLVLCEFVVAMNVFFRKLISWLVGLEMHIVMEDLKNGLPSIQGAINGTHILISKPSYNPFPKRLLLSLI